jgi:DNA polymerase IV (archaeal DinB-like DNA polymerase)
MSLRIVAHLDMDAFFASVEEAVTPRFKGKPIAVGTEPNQGRARGVVSTANYKAREYGIHSAMPISIAWQLSEKAKSQGKEEVIFLPVDFELYNKASYSILQIIKKHSSEVEQASIDEFYFSAQSGPASGWDYAVDLCQKIKEEIKVKEKITCSVGIGPNKLISKIAAGINKPNGMLLVEEKDIQKFLDPLNIKELPGVGPKTAEIFYKKDINLIKDLRKFSKKELREMFGKQGESIYYKAQGIDDDPIVQNREAKSIGEQTTFDINSLDVLYICEALKNLSTNVFERFLESGFKKFKTITITVRFSDFETKTSSKSFKEGIGLDDKKIFELEILKLILPFLDKRSNPKCKPVRLIGVKIEKFLNNPKSRDLYLF